MRLKHLFPILGYFFLLGLGVGQRFASPQEIVAKESWELFATIPPGEVTQGSVLGAKNAFNPSEIILPIVGDMILAHVNKIYALPESYVPPGLTKISSIPVSGDEYLRTGVLPYLFQLFGAAKNAGFNLSIVSAYRSYATQVATFNYWVGQYGYSAATTGSARPGHSEHQLGTVVDLGLVGSSDFANFTTRTLTNSASRFLISPARNQSLDTFRSHGTSAMLERNWLPNSTIVRARWRNTFLDSGAPSRNRTCIFGFGGRRSVR